MTGKGQNGDDRRRDLTLHAIRANWPILLAVVFGITGYQELKGTVANHARDIKEFKQMVGRDQLREWTRWRVNVERDIEEIRKACP